MRDQFLPLYIFIFFLTVLLTVMIERKLIPILRKSAKQPIYAEGPRWHTKKSGTPTMGGLAFLISISISLLICILFLFDKRMEKSSLSLLISLLFAISNSLIGIIDDRKKLKRKENQGLTASQKLMFQTLSAVLFLFLRKKLLFDSTEIVFAFGKIDLGLWYYPLSLVILIMLINSANLTDGIDGLASSVTFGIGISLMYISSRVSPEASMIATTLIGASLAFLCFNLHPAKIFMGDTGSLFFGALIASAGFSLKNPILMLFVAGVYVIEGFSVILQVGFYKLTHKRIFKMAPLHHHFEKCGWSENRICIVAILSTLVISVIAFVLYRSYI